MKLGKLNIDLVSKLKEELEPKELDKNLKLELQRSNPIYIPHDPIPGYNPFEPHDPIPGYNPFEPHDPIPGKDLWQITSNIDIPTEKIKKIGTK